MARVLKTYAGLDRNSYFLFLAQVVNSIGHFVHPFLVILIALFVRESAPTPRTDRSELRARLQPAEGGEGFPGGGPAVAGLLAEPLQPAAAASRCVRGTRAENLRAAVLARASGRGGRLLQSLKTSALEEGSRLRVPLSSPDSGQVQVQLELSGPQGSLERALAALPAGPGLPARFRGIACLELAGPGRPPDRSGRIWPTSPCRPWP